MSDDPKNNFIKAMEANLKLIEGLPSRTEFMTMFDTAMKAIGAALAEVNRRVDTHLSQIRDGKDGAPGDRGPKGDKGDRGPKGETFIALRGERGEKGDQGKGGSPDTPEQVRDKLELLDGEERLDASAIKNLPEAVERTIHSVGTHGPLWGLADVDVSGITIGQSIKWDGIRWIPFTPAGGSSTPVLDEIPTGSGTAFTLAHTPSGNTLRLYRGGARITIANGDYTLASADITLATPLQTGETLTADYEY